MSNIFPLYFYDINLQEKKFGRSTAYSCKKWPYRISSFYEKIIDTSAD